jgi:hypothetical protein
MYGCYNVSPCNHVTTLNMDMTVSDITDRIFVKVYKYASTAEAVFNGITGAHLNIIPKFTFPVENRQYWGELAVSWDGQNLYHSSSLEQLARFDCNGQPAPWPGKSTHALSGFPQGWQHSRGHSAGPGNSLYILHHRAHRDLNKGVASVVDASGNVLKREFIDIDAEVSCIRADPQGNVFVGARVKPKGSPYPADLNLGTAKAAATESGYPWTSQPASWWAEEIYGSVLKFGPEGGSVKTDPTGDLWVNGNVYRGTRDVAKAQGLLGMYFGLSQVQTHNMPPAGIGCVCNVSRFDVDRFGRIFMPDGYRLSMVVLDNNMNEILRLHNREITQVKTGYFQQLQATDRALYAMDWWNNQVVSFNFGADQEAFADIPLGIDFAARARPGRVSLVNSPNPFHSSVNIRIHGSVHHAGFKMQNAKIGIFDVSGKRVHDFSGTRSNQITWNGKDMHGCPVQSGVYFCRVRTGTFTVERKLLLVK